MLGFVRLGSEVFLVSVGAVSGGRGHQHPCALCQVLNEFLAYHLVLNNNCLGSRGSPGG